jgi:steroid delta-isomerase-like uncharacterized protein
MTIEAASEEENLVRRFYQEVINRGNIAAVQELVAEHFLEHTPAALPGQPRKGPEAIIWFVPRVRLAFPDLHARIDDVLVDGDKVAARVTWTGTHTGEFLGTTPTGKGIRVTGLDVVRVADGKLVEHWGQIDVLAIMEQLGFLPTAYERMG